MNLKTGVLLIVAGLAVVGCNEQQNKTTAAKEPAAVSATEVTQAVEVTAQQAAQETTQAVDAAAAQVQAEAAQAEAVANEGAQDAKQMASELVEKAKTLLAQARQYLDQGSYKEAITTAQNILSFDPNNLDAQKIIDMAKEKLTAMGTAKVDEVKNNLMNKLGSIGK